LLSWKFKKLIYLKKCLIIFEKKIEYYAIRISIIITAKKTVFKYIDFPKRYEG